MQHLTNHWNGFVTYIKFSYFCIYFYIPIIVKPSKELCTIPIAVVCLPVSIRINDLGLIVLDQLHHLWETDLL